ncbi:MAG: multicopper oxidase domain-containing protein [Pirellulaceae bacterium]
MTRQPSRRTFLVNGSLAAAAGALGTYGRVQQAAFARARDSTPQDRVAEYDGFSRYQPSRGNDPDGDYYIGKLVPGLRSVAEGPAPFVAPDIEKLAFQTKDGVKQFELIAEPVEREFLPGYHMNVWGFNGSMPGPTIEVTQGDRVRIIVHNQLPEATSVHWHGFELPVQYEGASPLTQNMIEPGAFPSVRTRESRR